MSFKMISLYETCPTADSSSKFLFDFQEFTGITDSNLRDMLADSSVSPLNFIHTIEYYYYTLVHLYQPTNNLTCNSMPWYYGGYLYYKNKIRPTIRGLITPNLPEIDRYVANFNRYFIKPKEDDSPNRSKVIQQFRKFIQEERKEFEYHLSPRQIIHRLANELLLFVTNPTLCNPYASEVSLEDGIIHFSLSVPDMDGEDLGTYFVDYNPIHFSGKAQAFLQGGNYLTNDYIHPHASSSGEICLGDRLSAVNAVYKEGSLLFSLSTICAILQTYNADSPYIELDYLVNGKSSCCYRCATDIDESEVYTVNSEDYCEDCVGTCDYCCDLQDIDDLYSVNDGDLTLCKSCLTGAAGVCHSCNEYWLLEELVNKSGSIGEIPTICPNCIEELDDHNSKEEERVGEAPFHE